MFKVSGSIREDNENEIKKEKALAAKTIQSVLHVRLVQLAAAYDGINSAIVYLKEEDRRMGRDGMLEIAEDKNKRMRRLQVLEEMSEELDCLITSINNAVEIADEALLTAQ